MTQILFYKFFDNFAYIFSETVSYTQDSNTHYVMVVNGPNDSRAPNGIGMYSYTTGNNGNQITCFNNLGPSANGTMVTTMGGGNGAGGVTWNTGVLAGSCVGALTEATACSAISGPCRFTKAAS